MELFTKVLLFSLCIHTCTSQMTQLAFQRALQARLNAMRTMMMQNTLQNRMNFVSGGSGAPTSNEDIFRQLNTFMGVQPAGNVQSNFVRQNRNTPTVVTLNGQGDNPPNIDGIVPSGNTGDTNSATNPQVVVVNQNQGFSNNLNTGSLEETGSSADSGTNAGNNVGVDSTGFQTGSNPGGLLLPDSTSPINTTFSQLFNTPFSFPSSSASFWTSGSSSGSSSNSPTQPSFTQSNMPAAGGSTSFVTTFSGSPGTSFSSSFNQPSSGSSTWNRFMGGSGTFGPTSPISGSSESGSVFAVESVNPSSASSTSFSGSFSGSQPTSFTETVPTETSVSQDGTTFSGGSNITPEPALKCTEEYKNLAGHTLCMTDDAGVTSSGVSVAEKQMITKFHNDLRSGVMPPAEDLMELKWDERLAAVAEKWAKQCTLGHDKERTIPEIGMSVGQNVAVGYRTWQLAIQTWYDEIFDYRYGFEPDSYLGPGGWRSIAHFTQIVHNTTTMIGCGYAECPNTEYVRYYVCNYAAAQSELAYPYTAGARCGRCLNNCNNGLCDCGDLICYNKGVLDQSTCTCRCPKSYKGRSCESLDCPPQDNWICGRDWPASFCDLYSNVKEECPYMCGVCAGGKVPTPSNKTFTSDFGCQYSGLRGTAAECLSYGNKGADMLMCQTEGGSVGCGECERYFNIKRDYCPVMCGLCDAPCKGMKCSNGGTLDTETCKCTCRPPFTGDTCEYAQCPVNGDPAFCQFWPKRYCRLYYNVPEECPYMCGICKSDSQDGNGNKSSNKKSARRRKR